MSWEAPQRRARGGPRPRWIYVLAVAALAVVAVTAVIYVNAASQDRAPDSPSVSTEGGAKGSPQAKVTIIEFSDFQCPFCGRFAFTTGRELDEAYVKTGKVRFIYRHFAFLGQESIWASEATECAGEQGQFWPYHDKLFASQRGENRGAFGKENLKGFARELGLDGKAFDACLDAGRYADKVRSDTEDGKRQKVSGTPTFFINGRVLEGARPLADFRAVIEEELAKGT